MGKKTENKAAAATELDPQIGNNLPIEDGGKDAKSGLEPDSQEEDNSAEYGKEERMNKEEAKADSESDSQGEDSTAESGKERKRTKVSVLEKVGRAAIARHGFKEVFVTSDGLAFPLLSDAKNHASALANKEIIKVKE